MAAKTLVELEFYFRPSVSPLYVQVREGQDALVNTDGRVKITRQLEDDGEEEFTINMADVVYTRLVKTTLPDDPPRTV